MVREAVAPATAAAAFRPLLCNAATGTKGIEEAFEPQVAAPGVPLMNGLIYLIGLIVVIMAILSFLGLR